MSTQAPKPDKDSEVPHFPLGTPRRVEESARREADKAFRELNKTSDFERRDHSKDKK